MTATRYTREHEHEALCGREDGTTFVYLASDAEGRLLYVGRTVDVYRRMGGHASASEWYPEFRHLRVEEHPSRESASQREAELIHTLRPKHNRAFPSPDRYGDLVPKLMELAGIDPDGQCRNCCVNPIRNVRALLCEACYRYHHRTGESRPLYLSSLQANRRGQDPFSVEN